MIRKGVFSAPGRWTGVSAPRVAPTPNVFCPFPPSISPHFAEVQHYAEGWATRHGLLPNPAARARFARAKFASFTARTYPNANLPDLCLAVSWLTFIFIFDDHLETELGRHPHRQRGLAGALLTYLHSGLVTRGPARHPAVLLGPPRAGALTDLWTRTTARTAPPWRERFLADLAEYLDANVWEAHNRAGGRVPNLNEYLGHRRHTAAVEVFFDFLDAFGDATLPRDVLDEPSLGRLRRQRRGLV